MESSAVTVTRLGDGGELMRAVRGNGLMTDAARREARMLVSELNRLRADNKALNAHNRDLMAMNREYREMHMDMYNMEMAKESRRQNRREARMSMAVGCAAVGALIVMAVGSAMIWLI